MVIMWQTHRLRLHWRHVC